MVSAVVCGALDAKIVQGQWGFEEPEKLKQIQVDSLTKHFPLGDCTKLGGGFKDLLFSSLPGEMIQFD